MKTSPDPLDGIQRTSVTIAQAREIILDSIFPLGSERIGIEVAQGRVLAEELRSERLIPPLDNSAMDGFAVRAQDLDRVPATLRVVEDLPAGRATDRKLGPGEAARIMTGAAIPRGADAVVMVEATEAADSSRDGKGGSVRVLGGVQPGENIRRAGADVSPGTLIGGPGTRLAPAAVGMLAAIGRTQVRVAARPRVAILATGDEIVEPDQLGDDGRIASSNSYALCAAVSEIGAVPVYLGIAPDRPDEIEATFREALRCDAVVSTGGVSVGDRDYVKGVLAGMGGSLRLWRVQMKPGAPLAFCVLDGCPVFGLPGNPASTLVTFEQFVRPGLLRMMHHRQIYRPVEAAVLQDAYSKPPGRLHLVRVTLERRSGVLRARLAGDQSSGVLLTMMRADGLAVVEAETTQLPAGSEVRVQLLGRDDLREEPGF